jgi:Cdc6-like AAA superfamily ATPase
MTASNDLLFNLLGNYKITLDNFFKMCLIIYRAKSNVPCVIMGESGVGKTALIRFLVENVHEE